MDKISRQLKIDLITETPNIIVDWFRELWSRMLVTKSTDDTLAKDTQIYYIIDDGGKKVAIFVIESTEDGDLVDCNFEEYWFKIYSRFKVTKYTDCQKITKILLESVLGDEIYVVYENIIDFSRHYNSLLSDMLNP